ncbi:NO-inducible flavohemoprotein [Colwellia sp. 20A7]|uniref:NO-inducible flavohemoprotein n=1 Tax=Colwellia sp. 20A7 TaxID=2689569 RepID=UPI001359126D|nr:NO-inducible flavohemoprotein [Colwellia sp. 20A7]
MLTPAQIQTITATVPAVSAHARDITEHLYPLMFTRYPQVLKYFNQVNQDKGSQRQALANAVIAYAKNIERLELLGDAVSLIAQKHCSLGILPEHYPIVGECLLESISTVLGDAATDDIIDAWAAAYQQLADILIQAEEVIHTDNENRAGGWRGERAFKLVSKKIESDVITSFYFEPSSGPELIDFQPGQYVAVVVTIDGQIVRRNYSLSDAPGKNTLRISVKREVEGLVSNYLHNQLEEGESVNLSAPCGDFVLKNNERPLFLVTAGVGITPAISMLNATVDSGREIHFIHAAQNGQVHSFKHHVDTLAEKHSNLNVFYVYDQPLKEDTPDATGYLSYEHLATHLPKSKDVDFYFLGPAPFMRSVNQLTKELELTTEQVHFEFFGPLEDLDTTLVDNVQVA